LRGLNDHRTSFEECTTLIDVLRAMSRFVEENRRQYENSNKELVELLKTIISVDDGKVSLTILNTDLDKEIRKFCASKGYKI
jgi:hypothetical protein